MSRLLTTISDAIARWDTLTGHPVYRGLGVLLGLGGFGVLLSLPPPEGMPLAAWRVAAIAALMAVWWIGRVLPMAITAILPVVLFPLLGVMSFADAAIPLAHPLNLLMLGGFIIGHAMEEAGLHTRLVAAVLHPRWVRQSPGRVVLALMAACAVLSGLISNTATTLMLLPVALELARRCTDVPRQRSAFVLALAYSASIGGVATLVGTPPNAILASQAPQVTFASWALLGLPLVLVMLPVAWFVVTRIALPLPKRFVTPPVAPVLGPWTTAERGVMVVLGAAMLLWFTRVPADLGAFVLPGWSQLLAPGASHDALVALGAAVVLVFLPAATVDGSDPDKRFLLQITRLEQRVPWSVLMLLGGGFSLAAGVKSTRLTEWLAGATEGLVSIQDTLGGGTLGVLAAVLVLCLVMTFVTELTSNTATTQIVVPVLAAGAAVAGVDPLLWMVPATVSASCAFMMPVATAPNAIASQAGGVAPGDMAWAGLLLNLVLAVLITLMCYVLVPLIF